ncbi:hypothetical protein ES708_07201 [subsurface metagenome]
MGILPYGASPSKYFLPDTSDFIYIFIGYNTNIFDVLSISKASIKHLNEFQLNSTNFPTILDVIGLEPIEII